MLHHSFQQLQVWATPAAASALVDSVPSGGLYFITDRESICKQQKSPHIALANGMCRPRWDWGLRRTCVRQDTGLLRDYLCLQDACKCSNFLFLWFRVHSWNGGCWPFELLEKYETAASLRLPGALLLWTKTEIAINLSEKKKLKKLLYSKSCKWARPWNRGLEISPLHIWLWVTSQGTSRPFRGSEVKSLKWKSMVDSQVALRGLERKGTFQTNK